MNDEIKEILDNIDIWYKENDLDYSRWFGLEELKQLKDYITNLQEENERLKANYKNDKRHQANFDYFQLLYKRCSKDTIIDDLVYKCEELDNFKKGYNKSIIKYGNYKSRCKKAIEYCDYLLAHDEVVINRKTYIKQNGDDTITNAIKSKILGGD